MASKDPLLGKVIGTYRIEGQLGKGGMGVVYKALDMTLQRPVALKLLPQHLADDEDIIKRFGREARASARLNHPNIVTIYGVGRHESLYFIAMEYITGKPLDVVIEEAGKLDVRRALDIIYQSADALAEAHSFGVIHRDIKPQNIMLDDTGRVRVMDFGLALSGFENTKLTATGMTMGTPQYMSPEQWQDSTVDARSDIYSLGITLYEMLAGGPPFDASTPLALMRKVVEDDAPPVTQNNPAIPVKLSEIVAKMIAKNREDRYLSAAELRDDLGVYLGKQARRAAAPAARPTQAFSPPGADTELKKFDEQATAARTPAMPASSVAATTPSQPVQARPQGDETLVNPAAQPGEATQIGLAAEDEGPNKMLLIGGGIGTAAILALAVGLWMVFGGDDGFGDVFPKKDFVFIQSGSFQMGSPSDEPGHEDLETRHQVSLTKGFWMAKFEVTQAQWVKIMGADSNPSKFAGANLPVENVSWEDVQRFLRLLNKMEDSQFRLPTEAEWEYACRAKSDTAYAFGDSEGLLGDYGWFDANSGNTTHDVGAKKANPWGLYDMHGNVYEWCQDWIRIYPAASETDPVGDVPLQGSDARKRVGRGGAYSENEDRARSSFRAANAPGAKGANLGFRVCRDE